MKINNKMVFIMYVSDVVEDELRGLYTKFSKSVCR